MQNRYVTLVIVSAMLIAACATQRFGRLQPLTDAERAVYECEDIQLELAKANAFLRDIAEQTEGVSGADVLGFLGDFGIGNSMEQNAAVESGTNRITQLEEFAADKQCTLTEPAAPEEETTATP